MEEKVNSKKGGRPEMEEDLKRNRKIIFRLTNKEFKTIEERMQIYGIKKISNYLRIMIFPKEYKNKIRLSKEDKLLFEINKIGVNINQIAKRINANNLTELRTEELKYLISVDASLRSLLKLFTNYSE